MEKKTLICYAISMQIYDDVRLKALFQLLKTEADTYGSVIKREIAAALKENPRQVHLVLENEFSGNTPLPVVHTLEEICWEDLTHAFARFAAKINPDLEEGLALIAKFIETASERADISDRVDQWAQPLKTPLLNAKNYEEIATILSNYFFRILQIQALPVNQDIKNLSFARFLRKKKGAGLCVACLYMVLGQRYGLETGLIDLAGRVLVYLQGNTDREFFFIDPLDNGKILSAEDCRKYIEARCLAWTDDFFTPLSSRQIVRRFLANMIYTLNKSHDDRRLTYVRNYLEIIKN